MKDKAKLIMPKHIWDGKKKETQNIAPILNMYK